MAGKIVYENTTLLGINKAGILKPDEAGYYSVILGALGVENYGGAFFYKDTPVSRGVFKSDSSLIRRVSSGNLRGEYGHPDVSHLAGTHRYLARIKTIEEKNVAFHVRRVWLEDITYEGRRLTVMMGEIKPSGPYGDVLKKQLENKDENVCFSGRYLSNVTVIGGQVNREIHTIICWDYVNEPGIKAANKYANPSLESLEERIVIPEMLIQEMQYEEQHHMHASSFESSGGVSAKELYDSIWGADEKSSADEGGIWTKW